MKIVLIFLSVLGLVSCVNYPYRGNYYGNNRYGNNRYVTTPYYRGNVDYGGYRRGYRDHDRGHDDFGGGYRRGYGDRR